MEKTIIKDILITSNLINSKSSHYLNQYGKFRTIYSFSNEDLVNCFSKFDFKGKSILSILGSSDQILDMYLKGATIIDTFDINSLTKYYFHLKKEMLSYNFPLDFYINFLNNDNTYNPYYMNQRTFNKFENNMDENTKSYWKYVFENFNPSEIAYGLFSNDTTNNLILEKSINYLNSKNKYKKINEQINKLDINFINSDVKKLSNHINKKYDYIYLSNIMQYVEQLFISSSYSKSLYKYKKMLETFEEYLNDNGKIINYVFNYNIKEKRECLSIIFDSNNYELKKVNSSDGILIYTKK